MALMAIRTRQLGPTDTQGARIKATGMDTKGIEWRNGMRQAPSITVPYDYGVSSETRHRDAAEALLPKIVKAPENFRLMMGACTSGYVFVPVQISIGGQGIEEGY